MNYIKFIVFFFLLIIIGIQYSFSDKTNHKKQSNKPTNIQLFAGKEIMLLSIEISDSFDTKITKNITASVLFTRQIDTDIYLLVNNQCIGFLKEKKILIKDMFEVTKVARKLIKI